MYGDEVVLDQSGPKSNAWGPYRERYSDRHRGKMAVVFQAIPFVVICYSNPRRQMHHLTEEQPQHRGVQLPQSLAQSHLLENGRDREVSGRLEPGLGASACCRGCSLRFSPTSSRPTGQVARTPWHHCPGWLCFCHGLSTVGQPHGSSLHLPDAAPTSLPEVHRPAWPCLLSLCCIGALPGSGGSWPAPRRCWKELTAAVHAPAGLDFPIPHSSSFRCLLIGWVNM